MRYYDYLEEFHGPNIISSFGALVMITGLVIIIINLVRSARNGVKAPDNPWGGTNLEWRIPSPPPLENFDEIPVIDKATYKFD
jgi:cytochrome c oxidase subunit 1